MKRNPFIIVVIVIFFSSCIEEEPVDLKITGQGNVEFFFSSPSISNQRINNPASFLLISAIDADGRNVLERNKIKLYKFNGNYLSEPISLNTGSYRLTEYFVLDDNDEVIYATPKEQAKLDYLINDPLPIDFTVEKDQTLKITTEVISTGSIDPIAFGYSTFSFQVINTFDFLISAFVYDAALDNFQLTEAELFIKNNDETLFNSKIADSTNQVKLRDGYTSYQIIVEKDGYSTYLKEFTVSELKSQVDKPLIIKLFSAINLDSGLVAFYPLSGNAVDESNNSYDGIVQGAVQTNDRLGNDGQAYKFDGVDDKIIFGDVQDFSSSDFSISFWVNVNTFTGQIPGTGTYGSWVINKGITKYGSPSRAGYGINAKKDNEKNLIQFYLGNQQDQIFLVEKDGFSEDTWYYITVIRQSLKQKLYVNRVLVAELDLPNTFNVNTNIPLVFGSIDKLGNDPAGTSYFNGYLDDIRFYDRALTLEEITFLHEY